MKNHTNSIDTEGLFSVIDEVKKDPAKGMLKFHVNTEWKGGTKSEASAKPIILGGKNIQRPFTILADEPPQLLGEDTAPNPQELLFAAMNACMLVGYVVGASVKGITLENLEIETEGELDLRGFLGIDKSVKPGYDTIKYQVRIKGDGTPQQFQEIHETVIRTSPNRFNMANPIKLESELLVE
jgi:uncharacterized OsmC-like protein